LRHYNEGVATLLDNAAAVEITAMFVCPGKAVRVEPIKPSLKAVGTKRLKLKYYKLLSNFAFNFNLRRYTQAGTSSSSPR